ncbi:PTS sugar transporter subunit IIA [Pseudoflavonifractor sp. 524-17]|uniref:PTS sugar transporter subunit IIA n=1 Tax=Pseudoflavonifractor sp. 524-17 TaxID=2304577 RepID=UPI001379C48B|nr:PTS sugar transporter subunit IIA [Pseudoflavonifractor sp. 524-17]NCE64968.1 PTS sugar transporter subunit IIA [Pseudoflavonifractor sp. 524-17]
MSLINLILISHGAFAAGMREAAEMILGPQEQLEVFGLYPGDTADNFAEKLEKAIEGFGDPDHTLLLADLPSGTPSNTAMLMVMKHHVHALSGYNLPALLEILTLREEMGPGELVAAAMEAGREAFVNADDVIKEREGRV